MKKQILIASLAILFGSAGAFSSWAGAAMRREGVNEKLLAAIGDADAQMVNALRGASPPLRAGKL